MFAPEEHEQVIRIHDYIAEKSDDDASECNEGLCPRGLDLALQLVSLELEHEVAQGEQRHHAEERDGVHVAELSGVSGKEKVHV